MGALAASNATENKTAQGVDRKRLAQAERDLEEAKAVDSDERNYTMQKRSVALVSDLLYRKAHTGKEIARAHTLMGALAGFKGKIAKNCTKGALGVIRKKVEEPTIPKAVDHNRVKTLMATMLVKANITNATKIAKMKALVADLACANDAKMKKLAPSSPEAVVIAERIKTARQAANDTCEDAISLTQRVPELEAMNRKPQDVAKAMDVEKKKREECDDAKMLVDKLMGDFEMQQNKTEEARKAEVARKASLDKLIKDMYDKADLGVKNATMKAQEEKTATVAKEKAQQKAAEEGDDDAMNATLSPPSYNGSVYINGTQFPAHVVPANSTVRTYPNGTTVLILRNGSKQELNMTEVMAQYGNQSSAEAARWKRLHERDEDADFENDISQEATEAKKIQSERESMRQKMLNNGSASNASQIPSESLAAIIKRLKKKSNCSGETPSGDKKDEVDEKNAARKALMQKARDALKEEPPKESSEGLFSLRGASFLELAQTSTREDKKALYTTAQKKQKKSNHSNHSKHNVTNSSKQRNASKAPLTPEPTDSEMFKSIMNAPADVRQAACAGNKDCLSVIEKMRDAQLAASNTTERIERLSGELMSVSSDPELSFNEPDRNHTAKKKVLNVNKTLATPKPPLPPPPPVKNCTCDDNVADLAGMEEMNDEGVTSPEDEETTARNLAKDPECFKFCANRLVKAKEEAALTKKVAQFKGLAKEFNIKVGCNGSSSDGANCSGVKDPEPAYAGVQKVQRIKEFLRHLHSPAGRVALEKQKDVKAKPKSTEKALAPEEVMDAGNTTADKAAREEIKQVAQKKAEAKKKAAAGKQEMEEKDDTMDAEDQNSKADAKESSDKSNNGKSKSSKTASKTGPKVNVTKYESRIASLESEIQRLKTERAADQEKHAQTVTKHETELALLKQKQDNATKEAKREKKQIADTDGMSPMEKKIQREIEISELKEQLHEAEAEASNASAEVSASADNKTSASATLNESNVTATANETKSTETEEEQDKELDSLDETETVVNVSAGNTTNATKAKTKAAKPAKKNATATAVLSKMGAIFSVKKGNLTNKLHKFAARLKMRPNATMNSSNSAEVIAQAKLFRRMKSMLDNNGTALSTEDEIRLDETAEVTENIKASLPGVSGDAAEKVASLIDNAMKKAVTLSEQEKTRKKEAAEAEAAEAAAKAALAQAEALKANETAKEALKQAAEEAEDERLANAAQEKANQTGNSTLDREEETPKAPGKESDRVYINIKNSSSLVNQGLLPANAKGDVWLWVKKFSKAKKSLSEAAAEVKTAEAAGNNATLSVSGSGSSKASSMSLSGSGSAEPLVPKSMSGSGSTSGSSSGSSFASISASGSGSTSGSSSGNGSASGSGSAAEAQAVKAKAAEKVAAAKKKLEETTDPVEKTKVETQLKAAEEQSKAAEENATKVEVSEETPADKAAKTAEKAVNATKAAAAKAKAEAAKAAKAAGSGNKKCQKFTTCGACGLDPACGWCATDNKCYGGDADGPNKAVCDNWVHHNCPAANESAANQADAPTASVSDSGDASGSGSNSSSESTSMSGSGSAEVAANASTGSASGMGSDSVSTNATTTSASSAISGSGSAPAPSSNSSSGLSGSGMSTAVSSSVSTSFSGSEALPSADPAASAAAGASNNTATAIQQ